MKLLRLTQESALLYTPLPHIPQFFGIKHLGTTVVSGTFVLICEIIQKPRTKLSWYSSVFF